MQFLLWYLLELNQGHMDFQSIALPPELRYLKEGFLQRTCNTYFESFQSQSKTNLIVVLTLIYYPTQRL